MGTDKLKSVNFDTERYSISYSTKNGLGRPALCLYLAGCDKPVKCKGCHNPEYWQQPATNDVGNLIPNLVTELRHFERVHPRLRLCILGGEPLSSWNRGVTLLVAKKVLKRLPKAKTIIYSWRGAEEIEELIDTSYFHYGVLGGYDEDLHRDGFLPASSNQYIWDFRAKKKLPPIQIRRDGI